VRRGEPAVEAGIAGPGAGQGRQGAEHKGDNLCMAHRKNPGDSKRGVTFEAVRLAAKALPEVVDSTSYGTPALKVRGKLLGRLHQDGECFVLRADLLDREILIQSDPAVFFITEHYRNYPWILVRFLTVDPEALPDLMERAWRLVAPKSLVKKYDTST
jgi:hypothetical protein